MGEIATKDSFETEPMDNPKKIPIDLTYTEEQYQKIIRGLLPGEMEDKWFIYFEDNWLYIHRSWTGYGIYKAEIIKDNGNYRIKEFYAERNTAKYRAQSDEHDIENFTFVISFFLLGVYFKRTLRYQ